MGLSLSRFTNKAQESILQAQHLAEERRHPHIDPEHLLLSLIEQQGGLARLLLEQKGNAAEEIAEELRRHVEGLASSAAAGSQPYVSRKLQLVFSRAEREAVSLRDEYSGSEHLLLGLVQETGLVAGEALRKRGFTRQNVLSGLRTLRSSRRVLESGAEDGFGALDRYCIDLIQQARAGKLDPVVGRDNEVRRVIQVLSRRRKNNPVLIGEPGVGKTAIVEGLVQRIVAGDVPETLRNKRILSLDLGALIAGARFRGDFEDRMKRIVNAIESAAGAIVLFIDELHTLVGAGSGDGTLDASNMLKPALARGSLRCVGATTLQEYKRHIEKDPALERRFQQILVNPPDVPSTLAILRGLKEKYELHHGIRIKDAALIAAASLSERYITERFLPDKAIDLIDEASARLCIEIDSMPTDIDQTRRQITQIEIELAALRREEDAESKTRCYNLEQQLAERKRVQADLREAWEHERGLIRQLRNVQEQIERARQEEQQAQQNGNLELAARLKYGTLDGLNRELAETQRALEALGTRRMLREAVDAEDIARVIHSGTGIPIERMLEGEREKLIRMEENLRARVVGQDEALVAVSNAIRRSRAGIQDPERPIGSFIFAGSTGVGKTELARALAAFLFDNEQSILRVDMSEYMEKHSVARMIGAPPGYVGFEEGGMLTEAVRRRPYSLLLLDEIEKAHPDVFNLFLQIMDHGQLTNSQGRVVDFKNTVIIMTTNLGQIASPQGAKALPYAKIVEETNRALRSCFRPEFLNRVDEIIVFRSLNRQALRKIVRIQVAQLQQRLGERKIGLCLEESAEEYLLESGYDPHYGARPLKRLLQQEILDAIAYKMLDNTLRPEDTVTISRRDEVLHFRRTRTTETSASAQEETQLADTPRAQD